MTITNLLFLVYLHSIGLSQRALSRIFEKEENYEDFYNKLDFQILEKLGFKDEKIQIILKTKEEFDTTKISELIKKLDVQIITLKDPLYPELLRQTPVCPYFLYVRGTLPLHTNLISVVGSRKSTPYSRITLSNIIPDLIQRGYGIVSGGAYGVDSLAHKITLENKGYTLAVFGTGIDRCYPKENKEFFNQILTSGGALVSPFPIGMGPEPYNFPIRNEIVAGMSKGTLVTEAAEKSGTLITAGLALDFGRDVFALPGEVTKATSTGTNMLIRDGQAKLILGATDILSEYEPITIERENKELIHVRKFDDPLEESIYRLIESEPLDISSIENRLGMDIATIAFKLSIMEVHGIVKMNIDGSYNIK
ncbi:MAG: DNA-processing protein DprA [Candidatus Gracilibacteria bacterium]|nr:DNA-processing protein DprA [Candidatus Gracilibacteria bacterium]